MKVKLYGTGSAGSCEDSPSFLVDEAILVDAPEGIGKKLLRDDVFPKLVLITHFHADHDFGLTILTCLKNWREKENFTVIAPKGAKERYTKLLELTNYGEAAEVAPEFLEVDENIFNNGIEMFGYNIKCFKLEHGAVSKPIDVVGYLVSKDGRAVCFTGDAILTQNLKDMCAQANMAFVDTSGSPPLGKPKGHMEISDYLELVNCLPSTKFVPIHMKHGTRVALDKMGVKTPVQFDVFEV